MTSYFDVYPLSIADENEDILKIHLSADKPPWDPSTDEYLEHETQTLDHQGQIIIPATAARGPVNVNAVILYSLAYDAANVMDHDNHATALSTQIQINKVLISTVKKPSV